MDEGRKEGRNPRRRRKRMVEIMKNLPEDVTITQHRNRSKEKKPNLILTDRRSFYTVENNSLLNKFDLSSLPCTELHDLWHEFTVVGSCNWLLCFVLSAAAWFVPIHYRHPIYLLNPSTQELKELPYVPFEIPESTYWTIRIGFGYDSIRKDYKVVSIVYYKYYNIMLSNVWVYSLNSNNWRKLGDISVPGLYLNIYNYIETAVAVNDAIHWMVTGETELGHLWYSIFSFDLVHEVFRELPLPPTKRQTYEHLVVMRGYLTVFCDLFNLQHNIYEMWVMKEYGVKESWTKQLLIFLNSYPRYYKPVQFWNDEILFQYKDRELVLYNTKSKTEKKLGIHGLPINFKAFIHTESLVMLKDARKN